MDKGLLITLLFYAMPALVAAIGHIDVYHKRPDWFNNGEASISIIIVLCGVPLFNIYAMYRAIRMLIVIQKAKACKKHDYITVTNLYGDMINHFGGARSIKKCIHCGKVKYGSLDEDCKKENTFEE